MWRKIIGLTPGELAWLVIGLGALAYELWAVATRGGDVLTRALRANETQWSAIPVGLGLLMGHLTGPRWTSWPYAWTLPFVVFGASLVRDFATHNERIPENFITLLFLAGYLLGILWEGRP